MYKSFCRFIEANHSDIQPVLYARVGEDTATMVNVSRRALKVCCDGNIQSI